MSFTYTKNIISAKSDLCGTPPFISLHSEISSFIIVHTGEPPMFYMPTRGNDILDLVFTNDSDLIHTCEVGEPLENNDHNIVRIKLNLQIKKKENVLLVINNKKANFAKIES